MIILDKTISIFKSIDLSAQGMSVSSRFEFGDLQDLVHGHS